MPIDRNLELQDARQKISDLLAQRKSQIPGQINATRTSVIANRKPILDALTSQAGSSPELNASIAMQSRGLNRGLESDLSKTQFDQERLRSSLLYENLINVAKEQGLSRQNAENFARDFINKQRQNQFIASENNKDRQGQTYRDQIANEYSQRGIDLTNSYNPYQNSMADLYGAILGAGTNIGTNYYLNNRLKQQQATQQPLSSNIRSSNTSLRAGSGFTPRNYSSYYSDPLTSGGY